MKQKVRYTKELNEYLLDKKDVFRKNGNIKRSFYGDEICALQYEMVKLQKWVIDNQKRLLVIFEGMDTAGKSSSIKEFINYLNHRGARVVALPKPNSKELGQWYFQRYLKQLPNAGEIVFFDRSWYNRAGIEKVFGFCSDDQHKLFYKQVNGVEKMLVDDGVIFFKFYFNISYETQANRLAQRENNPLKSWKLSELDYKSHKAYPKYEKLRDKMFAKTGTRYAPWCEFDANDKKRARLNAMRYLLDNIDYENKNRDLLKGVDEKIVSLYNKK
jgi:polyphosphate kinase 2